MTLRLMDHLLSHKLLGEEDLKKIQERQRTQGKTFVQAIWEEGAVDEEELLQAISKVYGYPYVELRDFPEEQVPKEFCEKVPPPFARTHYLVAIGKEDSVIQVATADPFALHSLDELAEMLESPLSLALSPRHEITDLLNRLYSQVRFTEELEEEEEDLEKQLEQLEKFELTSELYKQPPIVRLVTRILFDGLRSRASDIHLQPMERSLRVRYRIDGILYDIQDIPKRLQEAVISRIKVMGGMNIAEKRLPQDGRTTLKKGEGDVDVRISSVPTSHGERIVLRLLDKTVRLYQLEEIGLSEENQNLVRHLINLPNGIIFVTGPTGSGKTTTLYAMLRELDSVEKNIVTIEDPIEYHLEGISQIQVNPKKGLTFAAGLRSLLRQDPDVMMVGEVRDEETARIAIQAALTGHLVISTLHTNDSVGAVTRMLDIGIEPYLVASSVMAVIAQRLVRQICKSCEEEYVPSERELREIGIQPEQVTEGVLWRGRGCSQCMGTGYWERTAIHEILVMDDKLRQLVMERASAAQMKEYAIREKGMKTLRMDGADKVLGKITTVKEVLRVTVMDVM